MLPDWRGGCDFAHLNDAERQIFYVERELVARETFIEDFKRKRAEENISKYSKLSLEDLRRCHSRFARIKRIVHKRQERLKKFSKE